MTHPTTGRAMVAGSTLLTIGTSIAIAVALIVPRTLFAQQRRDLESLAQADPETKTKTAAERAAERWGMMP